jgi:hypothetical protein
MHQCRAPPLRGLREASSGDPAVSALLHMAAQPSTGEQEVAVDRARGDAEKVGDLRDREAHEVSQHDDPRRTLEQLPHGGQGIVERDEVELIHSSLVRLGHGIELEVDGALAPVATQPLLGPHLIDEDVAHGPRGCAEEVSPPIPLVRLVRLKAHPGLMHKGGGLKSLPWTQASQPPRRHAAEITVNQLPEVLRCTRLATSGTLESDGDRLDVHVLGAQ